MMAHEVGFVLAVVLAWLAGFLVGTMWATRKRHIDSPEVLRSMRGLDRFDDE